MNQLYLWVDLIALCFPVIGSFDKRVRFFRSWKTVFFSAFLVSIPYLLLDELFTNHQIWGFNPEYLTGKFIGALPVEELLFFVIVPFDCAFIYECCKYYFSNVNLTRLNVVFYLVYPAYTIVVYALNPTGSYSLFILIAGLLSTFLLIRHRLKYLPLTLLFSLIPFFIFNGILTGGYTSDPIVYYNSAEYSGFRINTIPFEDIIYGFSLLIFVIDLHERLKSRSESKGAR